MSYPTPTYQDYADLCRVTTGPASPKGYTWDELIGWHLNERNVDATVWVAREWEVVE